MQKDLGSSLPPAEELSGGWKLAEKLFRDQQEQYEALVRTAAHIVYAMAPDGTMVEDSPSWRAFTGQTDAEWRSMDRRKAVHPDDLEQAQAAFQRGMRDKRPVQFEYRIRHVSGEWRWMLSRATPLLNLDGTVRRWVGMLTDITEQKRADELLRESERRFRGTFDNAAVGIAHVALDGRWLRMNDKLCSITGYTRDELRARTFQDITHPDDLDVDLDYVRQMLEGKIETYSLEKRYMRPNGDPVWINLTVSLGRAASGEPEYFIAVVEDIQRRKTAEEAARAADRARERAHFFDLSLDLVCIASSEGHFLHLNPAFSTVLGHSTETMLQRPFIEFVHPDDREATLRAMDTLATGAPLLDFENRYRAKDGSYRWLQWRAAPAEGTIYAVARDVTADRELMEFLRSSEARYRLVTDGMKDYAICLLDDQGRIVTWNAGAERLKGYAASEMIGQHVSLFYTAEDRESGRPETNLERAAIEGRCEDEGFRIRKDGERFWANVVITALRATDGTLRGFAKVTRDFTERYRAEQELREKEASLRAGLREREILLQEIHHRVKNNLQVISSLMSLQARPLPEGPALSALMECKARVEAIALIHEKLYQTRDYAHVPFDEYVKTMASSVFYTAGRQAGNIVLESDVEEVSLALDRAIPCALILNELITNAMKHAFRGREGGVVRVELRKRDDAVHLSVCDDGVGLANGFSVEATDTLGLQLVGMLVEQLNGRLSIASEGGAKFRIMIPAVAR